MGRAGWRNETNGETEAKVNYGSRIVDLDRACHDPHSLLRPPDAPQDKTRPGAHVIVRSFHILCGPIPHRGFLRSCDAFPCCAALAEKKSLEGENEPGNEHLVGRAGRDWRDRTDWRSMHVADVRHDDGARHDGRIRVCFGPNHRHRRRHPANQDQGGLVGNPNAPSLRKSSMTIGAGGFCAPARLRGGGCWILVQSGAEVRQLAEHD